MDLKYLVNKKLYNQPLDFIQLDKSCVINTINAHSYCMSLKDAKFRMALADSDILLPDGSSMSLASKVLVNKKISKIAGYDIHMYLLELANRKKGKVFYLGSTDKTLRLIKQRLFKEFPDLKIDSYSPPYRDVFSSSDSKMMIQSINNFSPDILFVGMTAPKQEKWVFEHRDKINANIIVSIGAVFDFYAGNSTRAPQWIIDIGFEWMHRFAKEPKRLWKRYLLNNSKFMYFLFKEKYF